MLTMKLKIKIRETTAYPTCKQTISDAAIRMGTQTHMVKALNPGKHRTCCSVVPASKKLTKTNREELYIPIPFGRLVELGGIIGGLHAV